MPVCHDAVIAADSSLAVGFFVTLGCCVCCKLRREHQERLTQELAEAEERELLITQQYGTIQDEMQNKTAKLKKLFQKYQEKRQDLEELQEEFSLERSDLIDTIRNLDRQIKLKNLVIHQFIPNRLLDVIERNAHYDTINDAWMIRGVEFAGNNIQREITDYGTGGNMYRRATKKYGADMVQPGKLSWHRFAAAPV